MLVLLEVVSGSIRVLHTTCEYIICTLCKLMAWVCVLAWRPRLRVEWRLATSGGPGPGIRFCWPLAAGSRWRELRVGVLTCGAR